MSARRGAAVAVVVGIAVVAVISALLVFLTGRDRAAEQRSDEASRAATDLGRRFELGLNGLRTVRGLFAISDEVSREQFQLFSGGIIDSSPSLSATLLVTRVPAATRAAFEGSPGSNRIQVATGSGLVREGRRSEYFPVSYRFGAEEGLGRRVPIGLDLARDPLRGPALRRARDSGLAQTTAPYILPETERRGMLILLPAYDGAPTTVAQRRASLTGLVGGAFDAEGLGRAVAAARPEGTRIQIFSGGEQVFGPPGELADQVTRRARTGVIDLVVRVSTPVENSVALPLTVLGGGLLLAALTGLLLTGLQRRERYATTLSDRRLAEREHAESAQRRAEERFRRAFEDSGVGMALLTLDLHAPARALEVNDALCKLTGYTRGQLLGMDMAGLVHPEDAEENRASARALMTGEIDTTQAEQRLIDARGRTIWTLITTSVVRESSGEPSHRITQIQDLSERKRVEDQLQHLADHDPLTGLYNRRRFEEELSRALVEADRREAGGALLELDLDHFKYVNDTLGHSHGDELILRVAGILDERLRDSDIVARLGGDEFAVILPGADATRAQALGETLAAAVRESANVPGPHGPVGTTVSVGIALYGPGTGVAPGAELTGEELLAEADIAMYDAKEAGRDRVALFSPRQREGLMASRLGWVERIRRAVAQDGFVLHGQRIESLGDDTRERHELLLRMVGDDGELILPGAFLTVAERFDLIQEIDRWVLRNALGVLESLLADGVDAVVEINLSARSIVDLSMQEYVASELERTGVDPSRLVFEMTETAAIVNLDRAKGFAAFLREQGCEFALDDFGAGFASFYYLKHFAFDYLKIDGEFIEDLPDNTTNQLLVRALVQIAQGLGKRTIAEFVDDQATLDLLRALGVDYAQGFHVARPVPIGPRRAAPVG